jgi:hypothetical protein
MQSHSRSGVSKVRCPLSAHLRGRAKVRFAPILAILRDWHRSQNRTFVQPAVRRDPTGAEPPNFAGEGRV